MEKLFVGRRINLKKRVGDKLSKRKSARSREITSSVKRTKDFTAGSLVGEEKKAKERKLNGAGLIVQPVGPRMDQNPAGGRMLLRVEKEDAALLVRLVKLTKEGEEHDELEKYTTQGNVQEN
jgi:hypothetical protein